VSNYGVSHLKQLLEWPDLQIKPAYNQIELNPWLQHRDIQEFCKQNDIIIQAYLPLMGGRKNEDSVIQQLSKKYNKSPAQIMLKWSVQSNLMPLPKSSNWGRVKENFDLNDFAFTEEELQSVGDVNAEISGGP
jgi:diketogulonate reductase-like aldo/keto reductase